ncbi:MAG: hypothetical protein KDA24_25300, partial [Deltaproteobacteria bacterium]|nr:hypothetical protein [Deltaproteobacteria bacterium]
RHPLGAVNPRVLAALAALGLLLPAASWAGNNTYCVGAPGPFFSNGVCGSAAVREQHRRWHFHVYVTDGDSCYQCFDERDNTCETDFLRNHPGWRTVSGTACAGLGDPADDGVKFHVVAGKDVTAELKPPAPTKAVVSTDASPRGRGPYAVGDEVTFDLRARVGPDSLRAFPGGELVLTDIATGEEVLRVPVTSHGDGTGEVVVSLPQAGRLAATLDVPSVALTGSETDGGRNPVHRVLQVGECRSRLHARGPPQALLLGGDRLTVRGVVEDARGAAQSVAVLDGKHARFVLVRADGSEVVVPAVRAGEVLEGELVAPTLASGAEEAQILLAADGNGLCSGEALTVTLSHLPLTLEPSAPATCWTDRACPLAFELGRPPTGPGRERADALLSDPGLEVLARLGGQRVTPRKNGDSWLIDVTPTTEGRVHGELELLWSGARSLRAEIGVDVRQSIQLALPDSVSLGDIEGGASPEDTCVPLSFAAGQGMLGSRFSIALAAPCVACEAEVVAVDKGQAYSLPLDEIVLGKDEELPICLKVARCPTAPGGGSAELVVTPLEPLFADQVRRVTVEYSVQSRGLLACWGWLLWTVGGLVALLLLVYGFIRPVGFEPGTSVRMASTEKNLRRAARVLLEEQRGGRKGWYRSARVHIDGGGAPTGSKRQAMFTLLPYAGGVAVLSRAGVQRQDRRTRRMEPAEADGPAGSVPLARGRVYAIGDLLLKVGG